MRKREEGRGPLRPPAPSHRLRPPSGAAGVLPAAAPSPAPPEEALACGGYRTV